MTEEVIKECEFYLPFSENCNEILDDNGNETYKCSSRQDCYYKQLIRLKQQHNDDTEEIAKLGLDVAILEQENKELKEINTALIQEAEDVAEARMEICNQCGNRDDYNIPCKMIRDLDYGLNITIEERDVYCSALEEIRKLTVIGVNASQCNCGLRALADDILDKTNEVLSNENKELKKSTKF